MEPPDDIAMTVLRKPGSRSTVPVSNIAMHAKVFFSIQGQRPERIETIFTKELRISAQRIIRRPNLIRVANHPCKNLAVDSNTYQKFV